MRSILVTLTLLVLSILPVVSVRGGEPVSFELQVQPIMAASGCSTGACHGKSRGQNGLDRKSVV